MIPPRKAEGEVDLERPSGVWGLLSQLSSLLCCGAAPPEAGWQQFGCSKAERTKSPHKAGYGTWRQDFSFTGGGREVGEEACKGGNQWKSFPELFGEAQKARPRVPLPLQQRAVLAEHSFITPTGCIDAGVYTTLHKHPCAHGAFSDVISWNALLELYKSTEKTSHFLH